MSYRSAARSIRELAGRVPGGNSRDNIRHGQLAGDWTEVFAPVIFEHHRQELVDLYGELLSGDGTLLLDEAPFHFTDKSQGGRRSHFSVLAAATATASGVRLFKLEPFFSHETTMKHAWLDFLRSLPGEPTRIVCDQGRPMNAAINEVFPKAEVFHCEYHRLKLLQKRLLDAMAYRSNASNKNVAKAGKAKIEEISARAVRDEASWNELFNDTSVIHEGTFRRFMTETGGWYLDHIRRRPSSAERAKKPVSTGALEEKLRVVRDIHLDWRSHVFQNRERLNRLLMLIQLEIDGQSNEREYTTIIRHWLEANGGRPAVARRAVV